MWEIILCISIILFVMSQTLLKLEKKNYIVSSCLFLMTMGLCAGLLFIIYLPFNNIDAIKLSGYSQSIIAGIFFFIANIGWMYAIRNASSLYLVRTIMAALETILLLFVSYFIFKKQISMVNLLGIIIVIPSIYLIMIE